MIYTANLACIDIQPLLLLWWSPQTLAVPQPLPSHGCIFGKDFVSIAITDNYSTLDLVEFITSR